MNALAYLSIYETVHREEKGFDKIVAFLDWLKQSDLAYRIEINISNQDIVRVRSDPESVTIFHMMHGDIFMSSDTFQSGWFEHHSRYRFYTGSCSEVRELLQVWRDL